MTDKELAEIRRRYKSDKTSISRVRGCYVNDKNEIVAEFDQSLEDAVAFQGVARFLLSSERVLLFVFRIEI